MPSHSEYSAPQWADAYLRAVRHMVEEAERSSDPRVKVAALRLLERQATTIREIEADHWLESLWAF